MGEVDQFLDEVEAELERLLKENDDLRTKLTSSHGADAVAAVTAAQKTEAPEPDAGEGPPRPKARRPTSRSRSRTLPSDADPGPRGDQGDHRRPRPPRRRCACSSSPPATPTRSSRRPRTRPRRSSATPAPRPSGWRPRPRPRTERLERRPATRAQKLDSETETKRRPRLLGDIEREKAALDGEVENLRAFEREYRSRLKSYFSRAAPGPRRQRRGAELPGAAAARGHVSPRSPRTRDNEHPTASDAPSGLRPAGR